MRNSFNCIYDYAISFFGEDFKPFETDKLISSCIQTKLIHIAKIDPLKLYKTSKKSQLLRFLKY